MKKILLPLAMMTLAFTASAQPVGTVNNVDVTSDKLEVEKQAEIAIFSGNVKAKYKDMTLTAHKVRVEYDSKAEGKQKIKIIIATGDVVVIQQTDRVDAQYAEYHFAENEIIFKKDVTLNRNGNILKGDHLRIDLETKKAEIKSVGKKRVKAIYFSKPEEDKK